MRMKDKPRIPFYGGDFFVRELLERGANGVEVKALLYGYPDEKPKLTQNDRIGGQKVLLQMLSMYATKEAIPDELERIKEWLTAIDPLTQKTVYTVLSERTRKAQMILIRAKRASEIAVLEGRPPLNDMLRDPTEKELVELVNEGFARRPQERESAEVTSN